MGEYIKRNKDLATLLAVVMIIAIATMLMCSCTTVRYVPVETVTTEVVHKTDTVRESDSVFVEKETVIREARPEDSVMLAKMGVKLKDNERLVVLLQRELEKSRKEVYERHDSDSVRVDSIQVPYPVEKPLSKWQTFCIDYGKVMLGVSVAAVMALLVWGFFKIKGFFMV